VPAARVISSCEFLGTRFATIRHLSVAFLNAAGKFDYDSQAKSRIQVEKHAGKRR
jgi:hypothetical protein